MVVLRDSARNMSEWKSKQPIAAKKTGKTATAGAMFQAESESKSVAESSSNALRRGEVRNSPPLPIGDHLSLQGVKDYEDRVKVATNILEKCKMPKADIPTLLNPETCDYLVAWLGEHIGTLAADKFAPIKLIPICISLLAMANLSPSDVFEMRLDRTIRHTYRECKLIPTDEGAATTEILKSVWGKYRNLYREGRRERGGGDEDED